MIGMSYMAPCVNYCVAGTYLKINHSTRPFFTNALFKTGQLIFGNTVRRVFRVDIDFLAGNCINFFTHMRFAAFPT